jgi:F0F1-type ATP synthase membrane subunit a
MSNCDNSALNCPISIFKKPFESPQKVLSDGLTLMGNILAQRSILTVLTILLPIFEASRYRVD